MKLEQVRNTINMLQSPDKENHVLALGILNEINPEENFATLLLCFKFGHSSRDEWEKDAPDAMEYFKAHVDLEAAGCMTFKGIFEKILKFKVTLTQMDIYLSLFGEHLAGELLTAGYTAVEEIQINIIEKQVKQIKNENKRRESSKSS